MSHRHVHRTDIRRQMFGTHPVGRFNAWLAVTITNAVGTMWCAYVFTGLALISLPAVIKSGDPVLIVAWLSQALLQLVLLSIVLVGQRIASEHDAQRAATDHETLELLRTLQLEVRDLNKAQLAILQRLEGCAA